MPIIIDSYSVIKLRVSLSVLGGVKRAMLRTRRKDMHWIVKYYCHRRMAARSVWLAVTRPSLCHQPGESVPTMPCLEPRGSLIA